MSKKTWVVKVIDCPHCKKETPVQKPQMIDGQVFDITHCFHCYAVINNKEHKGRYVDA